MVGLVGVGLGGRPVVPIDLAVVVTGGLGGGGGGAAVTGGGRVLGLSVEVGGGGGGWGLVGDGGVGYGLSDEMVETGQMVVLTGTMTVVTRVLVAGHDGFSGGQLMMVLTVVE